MRNIDINKLWNGYEYEDGDVTIHVPGIKVSDEESHNPFAVTMPGLYYRIEDYITREVDSKINEYEQGEQVQQWEQEVNNHKDAIAAQQVIIDDELKKPEEERDQDTINDALAEIEKLKSELNDIYEGGYGEYLNLKNEQTQLQADVNHAVTATQWWTRYGVTTLEHSLLHEGMTQQNGNQQPNGDNSDVLDLLGSTAPTPTDDGSNDNSANDDDNLVVESPDKTDNVDTESTTNEEENGENQ